MNILIADDNLIIQMVHSEQMKHWGYDFDLASDGLEAVELAKKNNGKYDFCLMDVEMPRMNGIEATKIIRNTVSIFQLWPLHPTMILRKPAMTWEWTTLQKKHVRPMTCSVRSTNYQ